MDIEVPIKIGVSTKKADIVIYKKSKSKNQHEDILGIVETKKETRKDGIEQLTSYMQSTSCIFGVWTNGKEIEYLYKINNGEVKRDYIHNIPRNGEEIEKIGEISKDKLNPVKNLKPIFRRILNTLYSNTNISRREKLGSEMIKLLFCKIIDEKYEIENLPNFRIPITESETGDFEKLKQRIQKLFAKVKKDLDGDDIFPANEEINLDAKSIAYVVGELENISLLKTQKDVVGEAFETFAESKLVGEKGEFFTPREIVRLAIQILDPSPEETIIDPACGSGGFLIYALDHIWNKMDNDRKYKNSPDISNAKKKMAEKTIFGIDKENDLVKICKAYMTIIGDGKSKIAQENTLHPIEDFNPKAKELFTTTKDGELELRQFDYVMTNPPFGSKIKVLKDDCKYFDLGHKWKEDKKTGKFVKTKIFQETPPQELFIERCLQFLKDKGKLAIVLPDTYLHAPSKKYILDYLLNGNNLLAVIDLPHNTFRPYCNAKTCLIILQKGVAQQEKIIMAVAEEMGHDHKGDIIYRFDKQTKTFSKEIWDDTKVISEEIKKLHSLENMNTFLVDAIKIKNKTYIPKYYWEKNKKDVANEADKQGFELILIKDLIDMGALEHFDGHGSPPSEFKGRGEIPYIRVADIVNWEAYRNPTSLIPKEIYNKIKGKNGIDLQENDILFVKRGSYRIGTVALLSKFDKEILLTTEIKILRIKDNNYNITPFYLLYALSHELTQQQLKDKIFIETTLPNIAERWQELYIPIPKEKKIIIEISNNIKKAFTKKWGYLEDLHNLKQFGKIIT